MERLGFGRVTAFDKWKVEALENDLRPVINALSNFGLDNLEIPTYILQKYSKKGVVSVFDISMLTEILERDLRLKRCNWENGYMYLRW